MSSKAHLLIYLLRRDLRLADNPILHEIARISQQSQKPILHNSSATVQLAERVAGWRVPYAIIEEELRRQNVSVQHVIFIPLRICIPLVDYRFTDTF